MKTVKELAEKYNIKAEFITEDSNRGKCGGVIFGDGEFSFAVSAEGIQKVEDIEAEVMSGIDAWVRGNLMMHSQIVLEETKEQRRAVFCEPGNGYYSFHHFLANHSKTYIQFGI